MWDIYRFLVSIGR